MHTFRSLPVEVVDNIILHLFALHDLDALARTCRWLYGVVDIPNRRRFHRIVCSDFLPLYPKTREPYVWELQLAVMQIGDTNGIDTSGSRQVTEEEDQEDDRRFLSAACRVGFTNEEAQAMLTWMLSSMELNLPQLMLLVSGWSVIMMGLSPNLRVLELPPWGQGSAIDSFLKRANAQGLGTDSSNRLLGSLEVLIFSHANPWSLSYISTNVLEIAHSFHRLPSIELFSTECATFEPDGRKTLVPATSNFSRIRINHSLLGSSCLATLIKHSRALQEFTYTTGTLAENLSDREFGTGLTHRHVREWAWDIYPRTLGRAIYQHRSTLRVLNLDLDIQLVVQGESLDTPLSPDGSMQDDSGNGEELGHNELYARSLEQDDQLKFPTIGGLRDFPALTHLSIGIKLLLGSPEDVKRHPPPVTFRLVNHLPPNLQHLSIRGYKEQRDGAVQDQCTWHDAQIEDLLASKAEKLPFLQEVLGIHEPIPSAQHSRWSQDRNGWTEDVTGRPSSYNFYPG